MTAVGQTTSASVYVSGRVGPFEPQPDLAAAVDDAIRRLVDGRELLSAALVSIAGGGFEADSPVTTGVLITVVVRDRS